jgi:hypothetical protein
VEVTQKEHQMVTISTANPVVTPIDVFTLEPQHQQQVVDILEATRQADSTDSATLLKEF